MDQDGHSRPFTPFGSNSSLRSRNQTHACPLTVTGHPLLRGSITHHLNRDVSKAVVSDQCDVSMDVLEKHYNRISESEKREMREKYLDNL